MGLFVEQSIEISSNEFTDSDKETNWQSKGFKAMPMYMTGLFA